MKIKLIFIKLSYYNKYILYFEILIKSHFFRYVLTDSMAYKIGYAILPYFNKGDERLLNVNVGDKIIYLDNKDHESNDVIAINTSNSKDGYISRSLIDSGLIPTDMDSIKAKVLLNSEKVKLLLQAKFVEKNKFDFSKSIDNTSLVKLYKKIYEISDLLYANRSKEKNIRIHRLIKRICELIGDNSDELLHISTPHRLNLGFLNRKPVFDNLEIVSIKIKLSLVGKVTEGADNGFVIKAIVSDEKGPIQEPFISYYNRSSNENYLMYKIVNYISSNGGSSSHFKINFYFYDSNLVYRKSVEKRIEGMVVRSNSEVSDITKEKEFEINEISNVSIKGKFTIKYQEDFKLISPYRYYHIDQMVYDTKTIWDGYRKNRAYLTLNTSILAQVPKSSNLIVFAYRKVDTRGEVEEVNCFVNYGKIYEQSDFLKSMKEINLSEFKKPYEGKKLYPESLDKNIVSVVCTSYSIPLTSAGQVIKDEVFVIDLDRIEDEKNVFFLVVVVSAKSSKKEITYFCKIPLENKSEPKMAFRKCKKPISLNERSKKRVISENADIFMKEKDVKESYKKKIQYELRVDSTFRERRENDVPKLFVDFSSFERSLKKLISGFYSFYRKGAQSENYKNIYKKRFIFLLCIQYMFSSSYQYSENDGDFILTLGNELDKIYGTDNIQVNDEILDYLRNGNIQQVVGKRNSLIYIQLYILCYVYFADNKYANIFPPENECDTILRRLKSNFGIITLICFQDLLANYNAVDSIFYSLLYVVPSCAYKIFKESYRPSEKKYDCLLLLYYSISILNNFKNMSFSDNVKSFLSNTVVSGYYSLIKLIFSKKFGQPAALEIIRSEVKTLKERNLLNYLIGSLIYHLIALIDELSDDTSLIKKLSIPKEYSPAVDPFKVMFRVYKDDVSGNNEQRGMTDHRNLEEIDDSESYSYYSYEYSDNETGESYDNVNITYKTEENNTVDSNISLNIQNCYAEDGHTKIERVYNTENKDFTKAGKFMEYLISCVMILVQYGGSGVEEEIQKMLLRGLFQITDITRMYYMFVRICTEKSRHNLQSLNVVMVTIERFVRIDKIICSDSYSSCEKIELLYFIMDTFTKYDNSNDFFIKRFFVRENARMSGYAFKILIDHELYIQAIDVLLKLEGIITQNDFKTKFINNFFLRCPLVKDYIEKSYTMDIKGADLKKYCLLTSVYLYDNYSTDYYSAIQLLHRLSELCDKYEFDYSISTLVKKKVYRLSKKLEASFPHPSYFYFIEFRDEKKQYKYYLIKSWLKNDALKSNLLKFISKSDMSGSSSLDSYRQIPPWIDINGVGKSCENQHKYFAEGMSSINDRDLCYTKDDPSLFDPFDLDVQKILSTSKNLPQCLQISYIFPEDSSRMRIYSINRESIDQDKSYNNGVARLLIKIKVLCSYIYIIAYNDYRIFVPIKKSKLQFNENMFNEENLLDSENDFYTTTHILINFPKILDFFWECTRHQGLKEGVDKLFETLKWFFNFVKPFVLPEDKELFDKCFSCFSEKISQFY